jgi:malonyl-CoA O-methyltransferase
MDKKAIQASFSKAAAHYDQFADLQREIGQYLLSLIKMKANNVSVISILDLGCGTGYFSAELIRSANQCAQLTCFDLSPEMVHQATQRNLPSCSYVIGDIDALPFTAKNFDLIFSNLVLQWSEQLQDALIQIKQTLNDNGELYFSTLLDGSLFELQQAWKQVDDKVHVNQFLTEQKVQEALQNAGFRDFTLTTETRIKKYTNVLAVMKALKGIGANHVHSRCKTQIVDKQLLKQLEQGYLVNIDNEGLYNLSYQVCYVTAKK